MIREWAGVSRPRGRLLPTGLRPFYRGLRDRRLITASSLWIRSARTSAHVEGYQIPAPLLTVRRAPWAGVSSASGEETAAGMGTTLQTVSVTHIEIAARSSLLSLTAMCRRIPLRRSKIGAIDKIIFGAVRL